ncbi:MAG: 4Fe-4S dicluster domain-containing protein [Dehalococcoidia bacterium]|nr:MAG: 4Fe-4S dicluster domain-containing protein [Dehalococcoidia bacterium]
MDSVAYDNLVDAIARRGGGVPAVKCQDLYDILDALFTDEEARLAAMMPETPVSADMLAGQAGKSAEQVSELLEAMAKKGLLFSMKFNEKRYYVLFPLVPGMMENQLLTGAVDERTKKVAKLFKSYGHALAKMVKDRPNVFATVPFARVIVIDQNIPNEVTVQPYDKLMPYIEKAKHIAVVACHCRHMAELVGDPCSKPKDVCLAIGPGALYMSEYGLGKLITKEQAVEAITRAEKEGLVHCVSNTGKYLDFICNCCICHCDNLKTLKVSASRGSSALSSFISEVTADDCIGCSDCIVRCPMEALTMIEEVAVVDKTRCIGCGLCVSSCPSGAIALRNREGAPVPYPDAKHLNEAIVASQKPK